MKKIAIQGVKGSFHHRVAQECFHEQVGVLECSSFPILLDSLLSKASSDAVMAIENSIAGAILPNYALLDQNDVNIEGEFYLSIQHNLMALPGQAIEDINEVWSHPMAHLQCREFFRAYPHIKLIEDIDTADVARRIEKNQLKGIGAIASLAASELYHLNIIASSIQTIKDNATRFFILNRNGKVINKESNKASLRFTTEHKRGSLAAILNVLSDCKLNLTKIQSMPIIDSPWKYAFFVDVTFDRYEDYLKAKDVLNIMATDLKVLGEYKNMQE
jgi:prephenate dehydratase